MNLSRYTRATLLCLIALALLTCGKEPKGKAILTETMIPGQGLGKLRLGAPAFPLLTDVLGTTNVVSHRPDEDVYTYTEDYIKALLEVSVAPPGKDGRIQAIGVHETFQGMTSKGVRIGDSQQRVLELHGNPEISDRGMLYVYADGTVYWMEDGQKIDRIAVWDPAVKATKRRPFHDWLPFSLETAVGGEVAYNQMLEGCKKNAKGAMKMAGLSAMSNSKKKLLPKIGVPEYCECVLGDQRKEFGLDQAVMYNGRPSEMSPGQYSGLKLRDMAIQEACIEKSVR